MTTSEQTELLFTHDQVKLESLQLIWLNHQIKEPITNIGVQQNLSEIINDIHYFSSWDECHQHIEKNILTTLLVCSDIFDESVYSEVHHFRHIHSIYMYSTSGEDKQVYFQELLVKYSKIKRFYTNTEELMKDLCSAAESIICQIFEPVDETQSTTDNFSSWWAGYIDLLCHLQYPDGYLKRLINTLKVYYRTKNNNKKILDDLDEFETTYQSKNAIRWYTRPSFLFPILNKALRQRNTELLFLFGIVIQDIYKTLNNRFQENRILAEDSQASNLKVYRSQLMSKEEIQRLKPYSDKYLTVNCFFSTSFNRSVVEMYSDPNNSQQVLFEIDYDPRLLSRPYASIIDLSHIPDDDEVLFMPGMEFEKLDFLHDKCWKWHLKLQYSSSIEFSYENDDRNLKNNVIRLKNFLPSYNTRANDVDIIFRKLIELFPNEQQWISAVKWDIIGSHQELILENYPLAIDNYKKAIQLWETVGESNIDAINEIARIYNEIGYCYQKLADKNHDQSKKYSEAVVSHSTATNSDRTGSLNRLSEIHLTKSKIGNTDESNENVLLAISFKEKALENALTDKTYTGHYISECMQRLGQLYELNYNYDKAIHFYKEAIERYSQEREQYVPTLIYYHEKIVKIYLKVIKDYPQAIEYQLKILQYKLQQYELKPEIREIRDIQYNRNRIMESFVELADVYLEAKMYILARKTLNDTLILYDHAESQSEYGKRIIKNIHDKLKNMPFD
ncbi:unnamed protein product [Adineta ricciae]|uniref:Tetratricopeptide repeat protein n=1 Tax=Adineta ricciae TaxID=249248 RepID=A0A815QLR1_ADIRI|nr:unnamed protein product [Adineta ricciae]